MNVQKCRARIACGFVVAQLKLPLQAEVAGGGGAGTVPAKRSSK